MNTSRMHFGLGLGSLAVLCLAVSFWVAAAAGRAGQPGAASQVALATSADEDYCSGELKVILRRVLTSCGLVKASGTRGCQPLEARSVAAMSGDDFNALFLPLKERVAILQFDQDQAELDAGAMDLLDQTFADQRGASYFFVVSRASPEGSVTHNRDLSQQRANAVLAHLEQGFRDPDLEQEVGLLWLGEEFAQLDRDFCQWSRSRPGSACAPTDINRSAFVAWIDCRL
ncbi:MAG: hypothetical protein ABIL09_10740 [Gemmatimonadota bacterium]